MSGMAESVGKVRLRFDDNRLEPSFARKLSGSKARDNELVRMILAAAGRNESGQSAWEYANGLAKSGSFRGMDSFYPTTGLFAEYQAYDRNCASLALWAYKVYTGESLARFSGHLGVVDGSVVVSLIDKKYGTSNSSSVAPAINPKPGSN